MDGIRRPVRSRKLRSGGEWAWFVWGERPRPPQFEAEYECAVVLRSTGRVWAPAPTWPVLDQRLGFLVHSFLLSFEPLQPFFQPVSRRRGHPHDFHAGMHLARILFGFVDIEGHIGQ